MKVNRSPSDPITNQLGYNLLRRKGMYARQNPAVLLCLSMIFTAPICQADEASPRRLSVSPPHISSDKSVKYDYDIVYVRGTLRKDGKEARWSEFSRPTMMELGADLMLLHPDGSEDVLVNGDQGSVMDPYVFVRWRMGLLCQVHRRETHGSRPLQDSRPVPQDRSLDRPDIHAQHRRRSLVQRLSHARKG